MDTAEEQYELEQAQLANEREGKSNIEIDIPKDPEVNPEVYRDVEPLLFRGFITIAAEINTVRFVFKSLNQHEMELLNFTHPDSRATSAFWNMFLAYGVFMIDGQNVLLERERWIPRIAETFAGLQPEARKKIVWHLSEINRRASNAVALTECYTTEKHSRYRWYQLQGLDMTSPAVTGIAGTSCLGLNWGQLIWRALNRIEDINVQQEQEWEHAKFVGSCMAGKGISKIYQQDNDRRRKAKEEVNARKDKVLREVLFGEKLISNKLIANAQLIQPRTVEELADELKRTLRGEKDWHDLAIEAQEQRIREAKAAQAKQFLELSKSREDEFGGKSLVGGTDMRALSPREVQERIELQKLRQAQGEHLMATRPDLFDDKLNNAVDKYLMGEVEEPTRIYPIVKPEDRGK